MATDVSICNSALVKLGNEVLVALSDSTKRAKLCNAQYEIIKKKMMYNHPWNFAIKRVTLFKESFDFVDGDVTVGSDSISEVAHGKITGDKLVLTTDGVLPTPLESDIAYYVVYVDADNFKLATTAELADAGTVIDITAAAGGGTHSAAPEPTYGFSCQFELPSDYLRGLEFENNSMEWQVEGNKILANDDTISLKYIAEVDESLFTDSFAEVVAFALAREICYSLVQSSAYKAQLGEDLKDAIREARSFDAQEGTPQVLTDESYVTERF